MKVLIADDEDSDRSALCDILKSEPGLDILEVRNGQEALDVLCERLNPDLCLLDIGLSAVGGMELLKRIRREPLLRHLKVIITSTARDRNTVVALVQLGISGFLLKPYESERVLNVVRPLLGHVAAKKAESLPAERNLLSRTLLVVDDEPDIRRLIRTVAVSEGWRVVEAADGDEALALLRDGLKPDLCFSDILMPKLDGKAFVRIVRELNHLQSMPIVIISSEHSVQTVRQLAVHKVAGYIVKPFEIAKIKFFLGATEPKPAEEKELEQGSEQPPEPGPQAEAQPEGESTAS